MKSIEERLNRIRNILRGGEDQPLIVQTQPNDVVLVNLEGDCGLVALKDGTVEIQSRHAGVAVSDDSVSAVGRYIVLVGDNGIHLLTPRDRVFVSDRWLNPEVVAGQEFAVPVDGSSLNRMFKDETDKPVPFREVFSTKQVFRDLPEDSPHRRLVSQIDRILGG